MMHDYTADQYNFDRCEDCELVFLNGRVSESELGAFYTKNYLPYRIEEAWGKYASFVKRDQLNIDKARVERVKDYHRLSNDSRILDVGCGKPTFLARLQKETSAKLIGLDFSDEGWKNEREIYNGIDLRKGEVAELRGEKPVDVITMWHRA
jgi:2-polyprenyl-3-methyl-5-hydroxy-6-metoxy-1,4-benzoquinol methylase